MNQKKAPIAQLIEDEQRILTEVNRIAEAFQKLREPNSPHKTHFMVKVSDEFLRYADSRVIDSLCDRVTARVSGKSIYLSGLAGMKGQLFFFKRDERIPRKGDPIKKGGAKKVGWEER